MTATKKNRYQEKKYNRICITWRKITLSILPDLSKQKCKHIGRFNILKLKLSVLLILNYKLCIILIRLPIGNSLHFLSAKMINSHIWRGAWPEDLPCHTGYSVIESSDICAGILRAVTAPRVEPRTGSWACGSRWERGADSWTSWLLGMGAGRMPVVSELSPCGAALCFGREEVFLSQTDHRPLGSCESLCAKYTMNKMKVWTMCTALRQFWRLWKWQFLEKPGQPVHPWRDAAQPCWQPGNRKWQSRWGSCFTATRWATQASTSEMMSSRGNPHPELEDHHSLHLVSREIWQSVVELKMHVFDVL